MKSSQNRLARAKFDDLLSRDERKHVDQLKTPQAIQEFLDGINYSTESTYRCPIEVIKDRRAHCFDGAVFAAAMLERIGLPPLILEMLPNDRDDDHILALFEDSEGIGAIAKSNFVGLRWREPIHRNLRELVLSYFEDYFNTAGEKTLVGYTDRLHISRSGIKEWWTDNAAMDEIAAALDRRRKYRLISNRQARRLAPVDPLRVQAGLLGSNPDGLFQV